MSYIPGLNLDLAKNLLFCVINVGWNQSESTQSRQVSLQSDQVSDLAALVFYLYIFYTHFQTQVWSEESN